ncbi:MAG: hypothetical protein AB7U85_09805 [Alphaproteobacteria bacterium]
MMTFKRNSINDSERGSLLIEAIAMLGLISMVSPMLFRQTNERQNELADIAVANQTRVLTQAVNDFMRSNQTTLVGGIIPDNSSKDFYLYQCINKTDGSISDYSGTPDANLMCMADYLPEGIVIDAGTGTSAPNSLIKSYKVSVRNDNNKLTGMLGGVGRLGTGSDPNGLPRIRASRIASMIGAQGGYSVELSGNTAIAGAQGTWQIDDVSKFFDTSSFDPGQGSIFSTTSFEPTQEYTDFLHREFNGNPLLNTMQTTMFFDPGWGIQMDGGSITSDNAGGTIRFGDPASGGNGFLLDSSVGATTTLTTSDGITARTGDIAALAGNIDASNDVIAGNDVEATFDVIANRDVLADNNVSADQDVLAGNNVDASVDVHAGNEVVAGSDIRSTGGNVISETANVEAGLDVIAGRDVDAGRDVIAQESIISKTGDIEAQMGNVSAAIDVTAGNDVDAGNDVYAGNDVNATYDVNAGRDVSAGENVFAETGDIESRMGNVYANLDVISDTGNVEATLGDVYAGANVVASDNVISKNGDIYTETGDIESANDIYAANNITAGQDVIATRNVEVGQDLILNGDFLTKNDIKAEGSIGVYTDINDTDARIVMYRNGDIGMLKVRNGSTDRITLNGEGLVNVGSDWTDMWDFASKDADKGLITSNYIQSEEIYGNKAYLETIETANIALTLLDSSGNPILSGGYPVYSGFIEGQSFMFENTDSGGTERILNFTLDDTFNELSFIRDQHETSIHTEGHSIYLDHTGDGNLAAVIGSYPTSDTAVNGRGLLLFDEVGVEKIVLDSATGDMINFGGNFYLANDNGVSLTELLNQSNSGVAVLRNIDTYGALYATARLAPDSLVGYEEGIDEANVRWKLYADSDYSGSLELVSAINTDTNISMNARQFYDTELIEDYEITITGSLGSTKLNSNALTIVRDSDSREIIADLLEGFSIANETDRIFQVDMEGNVHLAGCLRDMNGNIIQADVNGVLTDICGGL